MNIVDLNRVRALQGNLDRLVKAHPQLLGQRGDNNRLGWEEILEEDERMTVQVAFRFEEDLLERLDEYVEWLREEQSGMKVSRADVVRMILIRALDQHDSKSRPSSKRRKKRTR